jgi:hypothetical protein
MVAAQTRIARTMTNAIVRTLMGYDVRMVRMAFRKLSVMLDVVAMAVVKNGGTDRVSFIVLFAIDDEFIWEQHAIIRVALILKTE